jgi:hypothetical protein
LPVLALSALKPVAVLSLPLALLGPISAKAPMAVFWLAVVMFWSALEPTAVLALPVVRKPSAPVPSAVLSLG